MDLCVVCLRKMLNGQGTNHKKRRIHKWCVKKFESGLTQEDDDLPIRYSVKGKNLKEIPISPKTRMIIQAKFGRRMMLEL